METFDKNFLSLLREATSTMIIERVRQDKATKTWLRLLEAPSHNVLHH